MHSINSAVLLIKSSFLSKGKSSINNLQQCLVAIHVLGFLQLFSINFNYHCFYLSL